MKHCVLLTLSLLVAACGGTREATTTSDVPEHLEEVWQYEAQFRPSDFDPDVNDLLARETESAQLERSTGDESTAPPPPEIVQGFRVQIFASTDIDEATKARLQAEALFPDDWFYLIYDPPTYKLRGGNFLTRIEADRFARQLAERGYKDSWVVPDRIVKNPPPRPAPDPINPDKKE